jgi:putative membrane protein
LDFKQIMEFETEKNLIVRDFLARQRTKLANDRTLLAYIRTSLYFVVSGTALVKVEDLDNVKELGYISFFISITLVAIGCYNYFRLRRKLAKGKYLDM